MRRDRIPVCAAVAGIVLCALGAPTPLAAQVTPTNATTRCFERVEVTYYHPSLAGAPMANGAPYDPGNPLLAASNRYRLGTLLQIGRFDGTARTIVEVVDRGAPDLELDVSEAAFRRLAPLEVGRLTACVDRLGAAR